MSYPTPENEHQRNDALRSYRIMGTRPEAEFNEIGELAARICDCPVAYVSFIEDDRFWFKSKYGLPDDFEGCPREIAFCSVTVCGSDLVLSPDLTQDERYKDFHFVVNEPHFRFYCAMPLVTPDGYAIGTICAMDFQPRELGFAQQEAMRRLAQQAMAQLDERSIDILNQRWLSEEKATLHELAKKYSISAERIRQLEKNAMKKIRTTLEA